MDKKWNKYYKEYHDNYEPLTEKELQRLFSSTKPTDIFDELALIWGMKRCAKLLEENGHKGAIKTFENLFDLGEYNKVEENDEDLL